MKNWLCRMAWNKNNKMDWVKRTAAKWGVCMVLLLILSGAEGCAGAGGEPADAAQAEGGQEHLRSKQDEKGTQGGRHQKSVQPGDADTEQASAVLTPIEETLEVQDGVALFGALRMQLEEGWQGDTVQEGDGRIQCILAERPDGKKEPFERRVFLEHYRIAEDCTRIQLLEAWTGTAEPDLSQVIIRRIEPEGKVSFSLYRMSGGGRAGWLLAIEKDAYIIQETVAYEDYGSFSDMLEAGLVFLEGGDAVRCIDRYGHKEFYYLLNPGKEDGLYIEISRNEVTAEAAVYGAGNSAEPLQIITGTERMPYNLELNRDINFDGYPDWNLDSEWRLWNPGRQQFEPVETYEVFEWHYRMLNENKVIWQQCREEEEDGSGKTEYVERLWQWQEGELVKLRECRELEDGEDILIKAWDYEQNKQLFEEHLPVSCQEGRKECFYQFYDGKADKRLYYIGHSAPPDEARIPQELISRISRAMEEGKELEVLKAMIVGREMEEEELEEAAGRSPDLAIIVSGYSCRQPPENRR